MSSKYFTKSFRRLFKYKASPKRFKKELFLLIIIFWVLYFTYWLN